MSDLKPRNPPEDTTTSTILSTCQLSSSILTDGGYDYELLGSDTDSRYECPICLLYLRDPVLTTCGHRFCERCISKWVIKEGGKCPVDGNALEYENIFPDNFTRREILQCRAKCPYGKEGCSVVLSLCELEKHIQMTHTGEGSSISLIKGNGNSAPLMECYYKEVGCLNYFPQEHLQKHLEMDMQHHLQLLTAAYRRLKLFRPQDSFLRQDSRDSGRWLLSEDPMDSDDYTFKRDQFRQRSWDSVRFEAFRSRQGCSRPRYADRLGESDESLSKGDKMEKGSSSEDGFLQNQNSSQVKDIFERIVRLEQSEREKEIKIKRLESQVVSAVKLFETVTRAMDDLTARYCQGVYFWKIHSFTKRCSDMRKSPNLHFTSPGFYTGVFEYKVCLRFNLNGGRAEGAVGGSAQLPPLDKDDDTFVSLNIHFMRGEFDEALRWPFTGIIKLQILHPNPDESITETMRAKPDAVAFARPTEERSKTGFGYSDFCPINKLFSQGYVRNDTLLCKISVKPA